MVEQPTSAGRRRVLSSAVKPANVKSPAQNTNNATIVKAKVDPALIASPAARVITPKPSLKRLRSPDLGQDVSTPKAIYAASSTVRKTPIKAAISVDSLANGATPHPRARTKSVSSVKSLVSGRASPGLLPAAKIHTPPLPALPRDLPTLTAKVKPSSRPPSRNSHSKSRPASPISSTYRSINPSPVLSTPPTPSLLHFPSTAKSMKSSASSIEPRSPLLSASPRPPLHPPSHKRTQSGSTSASSSRHQSFLNSLVRIPSSDAQLQSPADITTSDWYLQAREDERSREREREAKEHRKILDLQISNASLLALNAEWEKKYLRKVAEIRTLKQEGFHPLSPLMSPSSPSTDRSFTFPREDDEEQDWNQVLEEDLPLKQIASQLEYMINSGESALRSLNFTSPSRGKRVLNALDRASNVSDMGASTTSTTDEESLYKDFSTLNISIDHAQLADVNASHFLPLVARPAFNGHQSGSSGFSELSEPEAWSNGIKPFNLSTSSPAMSPLSLKSSNSPRIRHVPSTSIDWTPIPSQKILKPGLLPHWSPSM